MSKLKNYLSDFRIVLSILITILVVYWVMGNYGDTDMWFILSSGKEIVTKGIPQINPFTYIGDLGIVIQQWGWCAITWLLYSNFGGLGLSLLCIGLYILMVYLFCKIADLYGASSKLSFLIVSIIFASLGGIYFLNIRPTIITIDLLLLQILIVETYIKSKDKKVLLWLILISLLEVNIHSSLWVMHFIFLVPYIFPAIPNYLVSFKNKRYDIKPLIFIMIPMFLIGFLNPYGLDGMLYLFNSYGSGLNSLGIAELLPFSIFGYYGIIIIIMIITSCYIVFKDDYVDWDSHVIYFLCGLSIFGIIHARNYIYFLVGITLFFIYASRGKEFNITVKGTKQIGYLVPIVACIVVISQISKVNDYFKVSDSYYTPVKAIEYIKEAGDEDSNIYTDFNQGAFFEYSGVKMFMDARPEIYSKNVNKSKDILSDYIKYMRMPVASKDYEEFLDKYKFEYVCVPKETSFSIFMENSRDYLEVVN